MPRIKVKIDDRNRITLPKVIADNFKDGVYLSPNTVTLLIMKQNASLDDVIRSTELLLEMLKHEKELEERGR